MPTIPRAKQSRVLRYDYMRVVLVILVVLSHCSYYDIITPFGGIYYQTMMLANGISDTKVHLAIKIISNYLYSFHMPAFLPCLVVYFGIKLSRIGGHYHLLLERNSRGSFFRCLVLGFFGIFQLNTLVDIILEFLSLRCCCN